MITAQDLVRREVHYCASSLVSALAQACDFDDSKLDDLCYQAFELARPVADYEEAAREAGWNKGVLTSSMPDEVIYRGDDSDPSYATGAETWEEACAVDGIEPYDREVYEHWIVSDWLADKLSEKGEKVDKDFAGLSIWARTTTGQAIYCDHVIEQITAELNAA